MADKTKNAKTESSPAQANGEKTPASKKTPCPITREQFRKGAKPATITVNGTPMVAMPKEFSTGSLGWYLNGKTTMEVDGKNVEVQLGFNLTIVNSKELPA
jgi:hypothetical protein